MEGSGRGLLVPEFAWRDLENPRKNSVTITGIRAEIWTRNLQDTKQDL
jgi:hypothetical protein